MVVQSPLNIVADVDRTRTASLCSLLDKMKQDRSGNRILPFNKLKNVHFARIVLIPEAKDTTGAMHHPVLVISTNFDGDYQTHLSDLVATAGTGITKLLSHCVGFPEDPDSAAVHQYLSDHNTKVSAFYINTIGRSVAQVDLEARLQLELSGVLDRTDWSGKSSDEIRDALVLHVRESEDLREALTPAELIGRWDKFLGWLKIGAVAVLGLLLAIMLLPLSIIFLIVVRLHEIGNCADHYRPSNAHIRILETDEDHGVHNQLSAVGSTQLGLFRRSLLRVALFLLQLAASNVFHSGKLAGIDTIHFARWVMINGGKRLYFMSNFDGSPESYQDDFIERIAIGLNLVFSNGKGWPRTKYLLFNGASDEQAFKAYYRDHQIPTAVWFYAHAYENLTAINIQNNSKIRTGLTASMNSAQCSEWLQLF